MYKFVDANSVKIDISVKIDVNGVNNGEHVKSSSDTVVKPTINEDTDDFECVSSAMF